MTYKSITSIAFATVLAALSLAVPAHAAGSASFYLNPASGSHVNGSSFDVQVRETGGTDVSAVTAKLTYDQSKLRCNGVGGGDFSQTISATCGGGSITISRYVTPGTPGLSGDHLVGSVNLTALVGSGSTSVNFASGSQIASNGQDQWNGNTAGGTYGFTTPAPTPAPVTPTPGRGGGSSSTPASSTTSSSSKPSSSTTSNVPKTQTSTTITDSTPTPHTSSESVGSPKTDSPVNNAATKLATLTPNTSNKNPYILAGIGIAAVVAGAAYLGRNQLASAYAAGGAMIAAKTAKPTAKKTSRK